MQAALELSLSQSEASQEAEPLPLLTDNSGSPNPSADPVDSPAPVLEKVDDCVIIPDDVAPPSPIVPTAETGTDIVNYKMGFSLPSSKFSLLNQFQKSGSI